MNEHLRGTKRTTCMCMAALDCTELVHIYAHDAASKKNIETLLHNLRHEHGNFGHFHDIRVCVIPEDFNWQTMQPSVYFGGLVFVDHKAIECQIEKIATQITDLQLLTMQLYSLTT